MIARVEPAPVFRVDAERLQPREHSSVQQQKVHAKAGVALNGAVTTHSITLIRCRGLRLSKPTRSAGLCFGPDPPNMDFKSAIYRLN